MRYAREGFTHALSGPVLHHASGHEHSAHARHVGEGRRFRLDASCCVSELGSARYTFNDDAGDLVRDRGIIAGHAVHSRHPGHHSCGYPFLDGVLGEGVVDDGTFPIAMAAPLDC